MANGVDVTVRFDVTKFVATADDGVQVVVAERAAGITDGLGSVGSRVQDIRSADRSGAVIASVLSMVGEYEVVVGKLFPGEQLDISHWKISYFNRRRA
jgi:hypothetical protein